MEDYFRNIQEQLEAKEAVRETISLAVKKLQPINRAVESSLEKVQTSVGDAKAQESVIQKVRDHLSELQKVWKELDDAIGTKVSTEQYRRMWASTMSSFAMAIVFIHWIEKRELLCRDKVEEAMYVGEKYSSRIQLDFEDYLSGVCAVPKELARLCLNSASHGRYELLEDISKFVTELYAGFRLLNLKNDKLRRKFDGIKYAVQKIEEVIYDVKVRSLMDKKDGSSMKKSTL
eukprot:jgi/Bigna1/129445/aug1.9_g4153